MARGITAEIAEKHLNEWLEAELAVCTGQSYTIGSRVLTRANLTEIRNAITFDANVGTFYCNAFCLLGRCELCE